MASFISSPLRGSSLVQSLLLGAALTLSACSSDSPGGANAAGASAAGVGAGGQAQGGGGAAAAAGAGATAGGAAGSAGTAMPGGGAGAAGAGGVAQGGTGGAAGSGGSGGAGGTPPIRVLAIGQLMVGNEPEIHAPFVMAAKTWLASEPDLVVTNVESPDTLPDELAKGYDLILQLNYTPFHWKDASRTAFESYIAAGKGGWVGLHHAGLYGPSVWPQGESQWTWFFDFFGKINYENYIASFASASVHVEEAAHPIFQGVPAQFTVTTDEWYAWDKSPRPNVHVLANVDESSYMPDSNVKMGGDHPVIWTNDKYKARNLYIFMGHHPNLFQNTAYVTLLRNAIHWAGTPQP